jgi:regulator of CtrA degradation
MRDAMYSADPARDEWKQRVADSPAPSCSIACSKEGMSLVEEAATYLDGPGRTDSRKLNRELALVYAAESMEVTTRLMQAASWLVVQRAVREKDMKVEEAGDEKYRIARPGEPHPVDRAVMPAHLMTLVDRSRALYERVWRFDAALYSGLPQPTENHVMKQIDRLRPGSRRRRVRSALRLAEVAPQFTGLSWRVSRPEPRSRYKSSADVTRVCAPPPAVAGRTAFA